MSVLEKLFDGDTVTIAQENLQEDNAHPLVQYYFMPNLFTLIPFIGSFLAWLALQGRIMWF